ncbi:siderophore-interacting protein [Acaricomes phytoseiuli]|uniref:siderophore-interacting protein n=1 Tax=Acaricomes phytoseiuli TaxID=291968 RepID=UPI00222390EE|nr:siderophore-interacting protein [Acaricomes phytoseiuli]MCW1250224.1 siderophore-interacting protein [Acaricomes phytoseiuli]
MSEKAKRDRKTPRELIEFEVLANQWLSPHLVRLTLGGPGFNNFINRPETDKYLKLVFTVEDPEARQITRTYTVRKVDSAHRSLDVDFVVHGSDGIAGPWAAQVQPGASISARGPGGGYAPSPHASWHLFAGDLSAVPAIAAALEALDSTAEGVALIEIPDATAQMALSAPSGVDVRWILDPEHRQDTLAEEIAKQDLSRPGIQAFVHGERESVKAIRAVLFKEKSLTRGQVSISGYWARGRTEDRFQAEKREPIGQIFPENQ